MPPSKNNCSFNRTWHPRLSHSSDLSFFPCIHHFQHFLLALSSYPPRFWLLLSVFHCSHHVPCSQFRTTLCAGWQDRVLQGVSQGNFLTAIHFFSTLICFYKLCKADMPRTSLWILGFISSCSVTKWRTLKFKLQQDLRGHVSSFLGMGRQLQLCEWWQMTSWF